VRCNPATKSSAGAQLSTRRALSVSSRKCAISACAVDKTTGTISDPMKPMICRTKSNTVISTSWEKIESLAVQRSVSRQPLRQQYTR
jgi:hypothetical protein